ncbi:MAG: aromatic ring-hydroxylating dioxygenase subunit alpha [Alphaproteobacteria bacterium]|nr:aromatic ring-hydroxylating dioxygenase subunit alpha [Alphaproteobacteria bacterium]
MLTQEQNDRLTRVGPGTPMGNLLRRYWHPIAAVSQLKGRDTLPVKLLGEELVLYRDLSGTVGLINARCPHRSMSLVYGIPETCGLRCPYHGWLFDEQGACIEQPYEDTENPEGRFKDAITTPAYKVGEAGGMFFAYLGPDPVPVLPPWDLFVMDGVMREVCFAVVPCNWLQIMENSLDPVHVEWLHQYMRNHVMDKLGTPEKKRSRQSHQKIGFDAFEYGIVKRRILEGETEEDEDWAVGHPVVFPNYLKSGSVNTPAFQIRVPMDDENTAYWWYRCFTEDSGVPIKPQAPEEIPYYTAPVPQLDASGLPQWEVLDNNSGQDIVAWITQGSITNRSVENLGRSDKGIVLYRRMLEDALQAVEKGEDPINVFRDPAIGQIDLAVEKAKLKGRAGKLVGRAGRTGNTTKYSPILKELDKAAQ